MDSKKAEKSIEEILEYTEWPKVYIAGRLNDMAVDYLHNVHEMMITAEIVRKYNYAVFIPALDLLMGIKFGYIDYHNYFDNNVAWIAKADAMFLVPGWETSGGTNKEVEVAKILGIPVFEDIEEMNKYFDGKKK